MRCLPCIYVVVTIPLLPAISLVGEYSGFWEWVKALIMPSVTLALVMAVYAVRMLRDNLIDVLESDYVLMAKLKGLPINKKRFLETSAIS